MRGTSQLSSRQMGSLYKSGYSTRQIAEKAGIGGQAVRYHLHKLNIPMRPRGNKTKNNDNLTASKKATISRDAMIQYYADGLSLRQIADKAGVTTQSVHGRLKRAGVELRPQGKNYRHYETLRIRVPVRHKDAVLSVINTLHGKVV